MDWKVNAAFWDLTEIDGCSSFEGGGDFAIDLLGRLSNSKDESIAIDIHHQWKQPGVPKMEASSSALTKKARAANNGIQEAFCVVDDCKSDLANCRDYHKRHKVCELHSKSPEVTVSGQKRRFCQQCSRFHCLEEFDEGKRSCRKRLDGHNRRRRKTQPYLLPRSRSNLPNYKGTQLWAHSSSHVYPWRSGVMRPSWCGICNAETRATKENNVEYQGYMAAKHDDDVLNNYQTPTTQVHDSDCALSRLSSPNSIPFIYSVPQSPQILPFHWELN